jgi:hypothetical protein
MVSTRDAASCGQRSENGGGTVLLPDGRRCFGHGLSARDFYARSHGRRKTPPTLANREAAPSDMTSDRQAPLDNNFLFQIFPKLFFCMGKVARN